MDTSRMLQEMCHDILSAADIKAICQARNFSTKSPLSLTHLEAVFLSGKGMDSVMRLLTGDETALLHFLKSYNQDVDISFFENLYGDKDTSRRNYFASYTEKYKDVFKKVRNSLIRRGVLLIVLTEQQWGNKTKMERYRFKFPPEFETYLPSPFSRTKTFDGPGDFRKDILRPQFVSLLTNNAPQPLFNDSKYQLELRMGELLLGGRGFRAKYCQKWLEAGWKTSGLKDQKGKEEKANLFKFLLYIFSRLEPKEWVLSEEVSEISGVSPDFPPDFDIHQFCEAGWQWGCLAKHKTSGETYYRFAEKTDISPGDPARGITFGGSDAIPIDLQTISYESLEILAGISHLKVMDKRLTTAPYLIKTGKKYADIAKLPLVDLLKNRSPLYGKTLKAVEKRIGKQIIHENLMLARVKDLSLKVKIEKSLKNKIVSLPDDYIAFPWQSLSSVRKLVEKSGNVIKVVKDK